MPEEDAQEAQASQAQAQGSKAPKPKPAADTPSVDERTVIDAVADLLQTIVDWLRQEAEGIVKKKIVLPLQQLGFSLVAAQAAMALAIGGMVFISVASLLLLAEWLGWPGALYLIGGTLVVIALALAYFSGRMRQK